MNNSAMGGFKAYPAQLAVSVADSVNGQWEEGYSRSQSSSVSPRGYGSNGSTPHSVNGGYGANPAMNGYHTSAGPLGNMVPTCHSPPLPHPAPPPGPAPGFPASCGSGIFSLSAKQKSAFAPVYRPTPSPTTPNYQGGWASYPIIHVTGMSSIVGSPFSSVNPFGLPTCGTQGYSTSIVSPAK
ncbi:hypothetical protein BaRGS_00010399 [Batillaria attramentaria]|uniref:Uncharacterized protein n=1 Tax=Batillaria attramentaria TaxID=370345 RepID=A0ABD0LGF1_9CAEN